MASRRLEFDEIGKTGRVPVMTQEGVAVEEATRCQTEMQQVDPSCSNFVSSLMVAGENQGIQGNGSNERMLNMAEGNRTPQASCMIEGQEGCSKTSFSPPRSKTKGRCKTASEKDEVTLGAQGEKKGNRKCSVCKMYATHNSATCPTLEKNQERLKAMKNKKRGRPAGAKNKQNKYVHGNDKEMKEDRPTERRRLLEDHSYIEIDSNSEDDDEYVVDEFF